MNLKDTCQGITGYNWLVRMKLLVLCQLYQQLIQTKSKHITSWI